MMKNEKYIGKLINKKSGKTRKFYQGMMRGHGLDAVYFKHHGRKHFVGREKFMTDYEIKVMRDEI